MTDEDRDYFEKRAEAEIALAERATDGAVSRAHSVLAGYYLDKAHGRIGEDATAPRHP